LLDALAEKPQYRSRVSLIVFGLDDNKIVGRHWISYAGHRESHKKADFGSDSIAYKVLTYQTKSPCFISMEDANKEGENRVNMIYNSFFVLRLSEGAVLSVDWPGEIKEQDPYVEVARSLLYLDVGPAISKLLDLLSVPVSKKVQLDPMPVKMVDVPRPPLAAVGSLNER
jgi:hypothetical protein